MLFPQFALLIDQSLRGIRSSIVQTGALADAIIIRALMPRQVNMVGRQNHRN